MNGKKCNTDRQTCPDFFALIYKPGTFDRTLTQSTKRQILKWQLDKKCKCCCMLSDMSFLSFWLIAFLTYRRLAECCVASLIVRWVKILRYRSEPRKQIWDENVSFEQLRHVLVWRSLNFFLFVTDGNATKNSSVGLEPVYFKPSSVFSRRAKKALWLARKCYTNLKSAPRHSAYRAYLRDSAYQYQLPLLWEMRFFMLCWMSLRWVSWRLNKLTETNTRTFLRPCRQWRGGGKKLGCL